MLQAALKEVLDRSSFVLGEFVEEFEAAFAKYCGAEYAVGVNSGTAALYVALKACGIGPGDEVVTSPFTFVANVEAVWLAGATPRFAGVDPQTLNLDPRQVERAFTKKTRAVVPIHLYGHPADLDPVIELARERGAVVIEDAAQASGARYKGRPVGGIGDVGCFSFYPPKNLGALGEGGMVVTNDEEIARRARLIRHHGDIGRYEHVIPGFNFRMEGIQGAALSVKLKHLDSWVRRRREVAEAYNEMLAGLPLTLPAELPYAYHCYNYYTVRSPSRDSLQKYLADHGVQSAVQYPKPLHLQKVCKSMGYKEGDFPVSEEASEQVLCLPIFPEITGDQLDYVAQTVRGFSKAEEGR